MKDDLNRSNAFLADSAAYAVDGRLIDVPVAVVAERGVDGGRCERHDHPVRAAGAGAPGDRVARDQVEARATTATSKRCATPPTSSASANSVRQRAAGRARVAAHLTAGRAGHPGEPPRAGPAERLSDAGFISIEPGNADMTTFPPTPARALLVTGTESDFAGTD